LELWPKVNGEPAPCWKHSVLEDMANGWPGQCVGLQQSANSQTQCETACSNAPNCAVWQYTSTGCFSGEALQACNQGLLQLSGAQRIQHGDVRVLKDLRGWQVTGLKNIGSMLDGPHTCRKICYSDLNCEYWLYATMSGCWVQDPVSGKVQYPLTTGPGGASQLGALAQSVLAGEYIQHICPSRSAPAQSSLHRGADRHSSVLGGPAHSTKKNDESFFSSRNTPYLIAGGLLIALIACLICIACDTSRSRKTETTPSHRGVQFQPLMEEDGSWYANSQASTSRSRDEETSMESSRRDAAIKEIDMQARPAAAAPVSMSMAAPVAPPIPSPVPTTTTALPTMAAFPPSRASQVPSFQAQRYGPPTTTTVTTAMAPVRRY